MWIYVVPFVCLIVMMILICFLWLKRMEYNTHTQCIYCIMITGKDDQRIEYARRACENYRAQTYKNKKLVIINHHDSMDVLTKEMHADDIFEFHVSKQGKTLGDLRNIALEMVAHDAVWTTWDDDDWRASHYLATLYDRLRANNAVCVAFTKRYEYNANTYFSWMTQLRTGFPTVMAVFDRRIRYDRKDTMEDTHIISDYRKFGHVEILDNDPALYIRLVHTNNTSAYVDPSKQAVRTATMPDSLYGEYPLSARESDYVEQIMLAYFK